MLPGDEACVVAVTAVLLEELRANLRVDGLPRRRPFRSRLRCRAPSSQSIKDISCLVQAGSEQRYSNFALIGSGSRAARVSSPARSPKSDAWLSRARCASANPFPAGVDLQIHDLRWPEDAECLAFGLLTTLYLAHRLVLDGIKERQPSAPCPAIGGDRFSRPRSTRARARSSQGGDPWCSYAPRVRSPRTS